MDSHLYGFILICLVMVQSAQTSWWYIGLSSSAYEPTVASPTLPYRSKCSQIDVLTPTQQRMCAKSKNILDVVQKGAAMGIDECKHQFRDRRWNCTTFNNTSVFGKVLSLKSREKAYIYSIFSAGIMHAVTKACASGQLNICGCDTAVRGREADGFMWGGCSHNVLFSNKFTEEFLDSSENPFKEDGLMNLWNNNAGRRMISSNMGLLCKCHGVSGSCSVKICWRTMPNFRQVGSFLKSKFDGASQVKLSTRRSRLRPIEKHLKKPTKKDLVYLQDSPDYCNLDLKSGSLGTQGRECNKTSYGLDGCTLMCCGRGYYTIETEVEEDCNCTFFWCCRVECDKCRKRVHKHYCK